MTMMMERPAAEAEPAERPPRLTAQEMAGKVDVVRTTVKVTVDINTRMRHEAARRGMTVSAWVREAVEAHLPGGPRRPVRALMAAGAGRSTEQDVSGRIDEIL